LVQFFNSWTEVPCQLCWSFVDFRKNSEKYWKKLNESDVTIEELLKKIEQFLFIPN